MNPVTPHTSSGKQLCFVGLVAALILISPPLFADKPRVVDVDIKKKSFLSGTRSILVTVEHMDEGWEHYANNFEILTPDGKLIQNRVLAHPHVDEQPFTRDARSVDIPDGITEVLVRARDSKHGYGETVRVPLPEK